MLRSIVLLLTLAAFAYPAFAVAADWNILIKEAREAINKREVNYAFYKLRKAWLAVANKNLEDQAHQDIRSALADACALSPIFSRQEKRFRTEYSMTEIDELMKRREANSSGDQYSVELRKDGSLAFWMRRLDQPYTGEPICEQYKSRMTQEERAKLERELINRAESNKKAHEQWQNEMRSRMPIVYGPASSKYSELLSLCQPIKPGERKEQTGFDFSPFVPTDLPRTPDI